STVTCTSSSSAARHSRTRRWPRRSAPPRRRTSTGCSTGSVRCARRAASQASAPRSRGCTSPGRGATPARPSPAPPDTSAPGRRCATSSNRGREHMSTTEATDLERRLSQFSTYELTPDEAFALFRDARAAGHSVFWSDKQDGHYVFLDYADVKAAHTDWETYN